MTNLDKLANAKFLDISSLNDCYTSLPPGCDCICHTPCDFGRSKEVEYKEISKPEKTKEVYEIR